MPIICIYSHYRCKTYNLRIIITCKGLELPTTQYVITSSEQMQKEIAVLYIDLIINLSS